MKTPNVKRLLDWRGAASFGVVLVVALALSWWSLYSLAVTFYDVPQILAIGVSAAFDGAALFVADLASKYARTEDSGLATKLATYLFVGASVYLNVEHAILLNYGIPGMVLFGAPPVIAGILFELYLRFIHRTEMRANGLVPKRMPVFGKLSWMMFPGKTLKGFRSVIFFRLNETVTKATGQGLSPKKSVTKSVTKTVPTEDIQGTKPSDTVVTKKVTSVPEDKKVTVKSDTVTSDINKDMSVSLLVKKLWAQGVTDRVTIRKTIEDLKGTTVPTNTINKAVSRLDTVPGK
ncbi:DUF2637 domain-containing protein [Streptomyces phage Coruscant]|uniref:DUF2637 domain-containing protein n=1 Tax=Streptomyces phage Coruscant TaxID=2739834 RepID=A0A7G4AVX3_9CAUD|nr:DUF2637 domain-containing protein [Streptomyces phage Coruscant]QMP84163.1 DUF2637 domain-containing protein [Streptomyces phage Coruscant]